MKSLIAVVLTSVAAIQVNAQEYYPLPSPCDPDKIYTYLPNAAYENICVFHIDVNNIPINKWPKETYLYPNVKDIALRNDGIPSIPIDIVNLKHLETLDLSDNKISILPSTIGDLKNLKRLILKNNNLTSLPASFAKLENLEEIDLTGNPMQTIPSILSTMPQLKIVKAGGYKIDNPVTFLNSLKGANVTFLDLSNCALNYVPSQISYFTKLQEINLSNNNIHGLGDALFSLPMLKELNLSGNKLKDLPISIGNSPALTKLNLSNNELVSLPANFGNLKVSTLNVEGNQLNEASLEILNIMNGVASAVAEPIMPKMKTKKKKSKSKRRK
jgi:Leucine-rich repeat (LRR) protein